ncbi:hypothetical protein GGI25_005634 [Coemansia spiralis]|uniref:protein S-acyltransferase n=1 Tax=Coemansia spiralis TaxID=417178 RepID=A0A9W8FYA3_9FUNG|nr:hypothetical protein GGI25_005634 [Coemansia spiralis]
MEIDSDASTSSQEKTAVGSASDTALPESSRPPPTDDPETTTAVSYSPIGMAMLPLTSVHSFLPDSYGICHYHRPGLAPFSMEPRMSRDIERIRTLTRSLVARRSAQGASADARQMALERVVRKLALTMRADPFGRQPIGEQYRLALCDQQSAARANTWLGTTVGPSAPSEKPRSSRIKEIGNNNNKGSRSKNSDQAMDDDEQWVSESGSDDEKADKDTLTRDAFDLVRRIQMRAERRAGTSGIAKSHQPGRAHKGKQQAPHGAKGSLATAYARYMTDEQAIRRTVTEMGQGDSDTVLQMLRGGVSVNVKDSVGRTPLHVACSCGNIEGVRLLIHMGADVNALDKIGNTPLTIAATSAQTDIVIPLLEGGADPNIGKGLMSAMAMVKSRLRLLRAHIRHARTAEKLATMSMGVMLPTARQRRLQAVAVARECVDIIHLLRHYAAKRAEEKALRSSDVMHKAYEAASEEPQQAALSNQAASELDELSSQLLSLGFKGNTSPGDGGGKGKGKMVDGGLEGVSSGSTSASERIGQAETEEDDVVQSQRDDDQIEQLLERFSLLLGDLELEDEEEEEEDDDL